MEQMSHMGDADDRSDAAISRVVPDDGSVSALIRRAGRSVMARSV